MEIRFSFEELEIQKSVRKFVKNDLLPISREVDEKWALPERVREKLLSIGILKTAFPEEWGGGGNIFGDDHCAERAFLCILSPFLAVV